MSCVSGEPGAPLTVVRPHNKVAASKVADTVAPRSERAVIAGAGVSIADWDLLFAAVNARLSAIAGDLLDANNGLRGHESTVAAQVAMRECVEALQQLHGVLSAERRQHGQLENEFRASDIALVQARANLVDAEDQTRSAQRQVCIAADQNKVLVVKAKANYAVAKERCDDFAGNPKAVCVQQAKANEISALADAKMGKEIGAARKDAADDKRDAAYKVEAEKCDALAGDAKAVCVTQAKAAFGKS